jgi:hypothetical protein
LGNENPFCISLSPSPVKRPARLLALAAWLSACGTASALQYSVSDFRQDSTAVAADKYRLDPGWGDSLLLLPESFRYASVKTVLLSDGHFNDGDAGASPVGASIGTYKFRLLYLSWKGSLHDASTAPPSKEAPRANLVSRIVDLSPDTAAVDDSSRLVSGDENVLAVSPIVYSNGPPAPTYLSFGAEGNNFAAYWGSGTPNGPVRRLTHKETLAFPPTGGVYVPKGGTPIQTGGFGRLSSAVVPGSGANKTVIAYETDFATRKFIVRWENLNGAGASTVSAEYARPVFPEDFAVAADSNENSVILWRENADLYAMAFNAAHAELQAPVLIQAGVAYNDSIEHMYRPYAVASLKKNAFIVAYAQEGGGLCNIMTRTIALPGAGGWAVGAPVAVTSNHWNLFPDIAVSADRAVIGYFQRIAGATSVRRFMGSIMDKSGNTLSFNVGRTDLDFANENISFTGVHPNWNRYHALKAANVAIDSKGNVIAAYDSGTFAKVALVRNTPIYYDSSAFNSRILQVANPAIPAFVFNPATDSVAFDPPVALTTDSLKTALKLAVSPDNAFAGPSAGFQKLTAPLKAATGYYRYRVEMLTTKTGNPTTTNLTTPKVKTLTLDYNVKPWTPVVDSVRTGAKPQTAWNAGASYSLLTRKDSLKLVCSGFDADDDGLSFRVSLGNTILQTAPGVRTAAGAYAATLTFLPPDTTLNPLVLTLTTLDSKGWVSRPLTLSFGFRNVPPVQTVRIYRNKARDSSSVFRPSGAGVDTLIPVNGGLLFVQDGDSLGVKAKYADSNDASVTATWLRNSANLGTRTLPSTDSLEFNFAPDQAAPLIDTLVLKVGDKDSTVTLKIPVRPNRLPAVDSVVHVSYQGKDAVWKPGPYDKVKDFASDTGLVIPSGLTTLIQAGISDPDPGEAVSTKWQVWRQPAGCARSDLSCYVQADSAVGTSITRVFAIQEAFLTVRATDPTGAFQERRIWLEYPVLDTTGTGAAGYAAAVKRLTGNIAFTIDAAQRDTTVKADVSSQGTASLLITSVSTQSNDRKWADLKLDWISGTPPKADSARFPGATNVNALIGGRTITLPPGNSLTFSFHFFSDSLRGDSVLTDTLLVQTNDFVNPVLRIPFSILYRDLPVATLSVPGAARAGPAGGYNAAGLPALVPARSSIAVAFSETVRILDPAKSFRVYSLLDSLKRPAGKGTIAGTYVYKRKAAGLGKPGKIAAAGDSLADTVVFFPAYDRASDSLKVKPNPGYFIYRDVLRIALSNGITDRAGNALDLRLNKSVLVPGSLDSAFQVRVDTSYLAVISTRPAQGEKAWDPESPMRIRFNRKLTLRPPSGTDSLTLLDLSAVRNADNRAVRVTSLYRQGRGYDFRTLSLADNDSTLVIATRPYLPALDTVTLTLSGGILDTSGLSLDGNGNRLPEWLYDQRDTVDEFTLTFTTRDADFYVFPNPFRFSDSRHRDKGSITFKNLNTLRGYALGNDVTLRIHTMTGDLVYKTSTEAAAAGDTEKRIHTSLDWNLDNSHGSTVGTGVYIYTLMAGKDRVLTKGKVAVVR